MADPIKQQSRTALVLGGGGTRGAYEAGVVHYIRTMLPNKLGEKLKFHVQSGSSVGAINTAFMAAMSHDPLEQGSRLVHLWRNLRNEHIYRRGAVSVGRFVTRLAVGLGSHLVGLKGFAEPNDDALHFRGLFDTQPFFQMLRQSCPWQNISKNIAEGCIDAVAISATNMATGELEIFLQKNDQVPHSPRIRTRIIRKVTPRHVMASAALPILFPPVPIHNIYYSDGGLRLSTPLAPAVACAANRILIIGTRDHLSEQDEREIETQARIKPPAQPTLGEILGNVYHAVLQDRLETDRDNLNRINRVLSACQDRVSPELYAEICKEARVHEIQVLSIFPSQKFSKIVDETMEGSLSRMKTVGSFERMILRMLEADPKRGTDLVSYFLFEPTYLEKIIEMGFEDARKHHDELAAFAEESVFGESN